MRTRWIGVVLGVVMLSACEDGDAEDMALDASNCQDRTFYEENVEFCANIGPGELDADTIRPGISEADCDDPTADLTMAEWTEFCSGVVSEAPVSDGPHEWPDGIAAEVVSVSTEPDAESGNPANDTYATVTIRFTNTGDQTFTGWSGDSTATPTGTLLYGENRYEASQYGCQDPSLGDVPRQLVPGTSADYAICAYLPAPELVTLAVEVQPVWGGSYEPFTFTGVEALVR